MTDKSVGLGSSDPALFGYAMMAATVNAMTRPATVGSAMATAAVEMQRAWWAAWLPGVASAASAPASAVPTADRRFADPAWDRQPPLTALRDCYLVWSRFVEELVTATAPEDPALAAKAVFFARLMTAACAPTNCLWTNPAAWRRARDTGGRSLADGATNAFNDLLSSGGRPSKVDARPFKVGVNLAVTPASVVYRNELFELLQYAPQTDTVHARPLLVVPPMINRYYLLDLAPNRSLVEWAVRQGRTVFVISWRNATVSMADVSFDDYVTSGTLPALEAVRSITGSDQVDLLGLCLGGTLTGLTAAYLQARGDGDLIGSITLLNTLLDFSMPGSLGVYVDEATVDNLEVKVNRQGYLAGNDMSLAFDLLRADDLVFNPMIEGWLMGRTPRAFDLLAWNADTTNLPARMYIEYLRSCYLENRLVNGTMSVAGRRLDLSAVTVDCYVVAAANDHIVLPEAAFLSSQALGGDVRFVLSNGGHIAAVANPPVPKGWYLAGDDADPAFDLAAWRGSAVKRQGTTWWSDWADWSADRAGERQAPPSLGNADYPVLCAGPGTYVLL